METIKFANNTRMNAKVGEIVVALKEEIISSIHPKSIILSGSFGKGEVTVIEGKKGGLKFLSDCEIIIIPNKYILDLHNIKRISKNFNHEKNLKVDISGVILSIYLLVPFLNRRLRPTMAIYDLKYGSKVIYGINYLEKIPDFKPDDIPLWEGIRLLFNRMIEALDYFSLEDPDREMVFWTDKLIFACQDALLLSIGMYHFSYEKRNEIFQDIFLDYFGWLNYEMPNFLDLTIEATKRKLNISINVNDPIKYWFDVARICDIVFRYVVEKDMGIKFGDYLEFQDKYILYSKDKKGFIGSFYITSTIQNFATIIKVICISKSVPPAELMKRTGVPWKNIAYSLIPLIYFSLFPNEPIQAYLDKVNEFLPLTHKESNKYINVKDYSRLIKQIIF